MNRAACSDQTAEEGQAVNPSITEGPPFHFPEASLVYFQFVFAAITPILMLGSVLGRVNFKAWIPFVLLWITFVYTVNAFLIWGGGYFAAHGALDYSGGYVIHLSAGISGFVRAAVIGPRLQRDREIDAPNNLLMVAAGAGLLWLGWNGFNGGDSYYAGAERFGGGAQHQPLHRGRDARLDRVGLHLPRQAVTARLGQRDDHGAGRRSRPPPVSSTAGERSSSGSSTRRSCGWRSGSSVEHRSFRTCRRHPGGDLHARYRRSHGRPDGRPAWPTRDRRVHRRGRCVQPAWEDRSAPGRWLDAAALAGGDGRVGDRVQRRS